VNWAKKKLSGPFEKLATVEAVRDFLAKPPAVVGFFRQASGPGICVFLHFRTRCMLWIAVVLHVL
jgi:hypothetical protein